MPTATKKALAQSMRNLVRTNSFHSVSVTDITEGCGLSRKSFYYHFEDKYDLLRWIFRTELDDHLRDREIPSFWALLEQIMRYLDLNRLFYRNALSDREDLRLREAIAKLLQKHLWQSLSNRLDSGSYYTRLQREEACSAILAEAYVASIEWWLERAPAITPAQFVDLFRLAAG